LIFPFEIPPVKLVTRELVHGLGKKEALIGAHRTFLVRIKEEKN
jgi:hypothetical protein